MNNNTSKIARIIHTIDNNTQETRTKLADSISFIKMLSPIRILLSIQIFNPPINETPTYKPWNKSDSLNQNYTKSLESYKYIIQDEEYEQSNENDHTP